MEVSRASALMDWGSVRIEKYVLPSGRCPFDDWFNKLDMQDQALIDTRFDRVARGNFGDVKPLGDGVYELKFKSGAGFRVYFGRSGKQVILLLCAGSKRSQTKDIAAAKNYFACFVGEKKNAERKL
jgi:putative addiction module killer protein